jgi:hypothetical protein
MVLELVNLRGQQQVQIRKSEDHRVNVIAELIEHLTDFKYHIKPFDMAVEIVKSMDQMQGIDYAKKLKEYQNHENHFSNKGSV